MAEVIPIWYHQNFCSLERLMTFASVFKSDSFCGSHTSWKEYPRPCLFKTGQQNISNPKAPADATSSKSIWRPH